MSEKQFEECSIEEATNVDVNAKGFEKEVDA